MRWRPLWIGMGAVVVVAAATAWYATRFGALRLQTRAMPGFDIDLPDGEIAVERLDYGDGRRTIDDPGGFPSSQIQLSWAAGGLSDDGQVAREIQAAGAIMNGDPRPISPAPKVDVPGQKTRSWAFHINHEINWTTQIVCGARVVKVMTWSGRLGVERLHRRIASSFRCRPDSANEASVGKQRPGGDVPVIFDLDPGWFSQPTRHSEQLVVTNRRAMMMIQQLVSLSTPDAAVQMAKAWSVTTGLSLGERVGDDWPFDSTQNGLRLQGWMTVRPCPLVGRTLLIMAAPLGVKDVDARELLSRARCRLPGEPAQTFPELLPSKAAK